MDIFPFRVAPGGDQLLDVTAEWLRYHECTEGIAFPQIRVESALGAFLLKPGQAARFPAESHFHIRNDAGVADIAGRLIYGGGPVSIDDGTVSGEVSIIDSGKMLSRRGKAWSGEIWVPANPATVQAVQCWNPVDSGKLVVVERAAVTGSVSGRIMHWGVTRTLMAAPGYSYLLNWSRGATTAECSQAATATIAYQQAVNLAAIDYAHLIRRSYVPTNYAEVEWAPKKPLILAPGVGLIIFDSDFNSAIYANFDGTEEDYP